MVKTVTISVSLPSTLLKEVDKKAGEMNISRSALLTALASVGLKNGIKWTYGGGE